MPFRDVIGHRRVVALLSRSVQRGTLPPSLIFAGPSGVGKRLVAVATAQALNCTGASQSDRGVGQSDRGVGQSDRGVGQSDRGVGQSDPIKKVGQSGPFKKIGQVDDGANQSGPFKDDACGTCAACTRIARGVHADVLIVEPGDSGSIKIDQIRDLVERAAYRPFEGRRRVVIIDEADALVAHAQNALLKTLEEPPPSSVFLLVTSLPDLLLATVRSRCPRLQFRPLGADEVAEALMKRGRSEVEAHAVAATADGSIGRALEASAADFVEARDVAVRVLAQAAPGDDRRRSGSPGNLDAAKELLAGTGKGGASDREQLAVHLRAMASLLRDIEVLGSGATNEALANPDVRPALDRLTAYRGERGIRAFAAVDRALAALDRNAGVKLVADWLALNL